MTADANQSHPSGDGPLALALLALTAPTSLVGAVSQPGLGHVCTAKMMGNVVVLGFALAGTGGLSVARCSLATGASFAGAVVGVRLGAAIMMGLRRRRTSVAEATEAILLIAAGSIALSQRLSPPSRGCSSSI
jgi:uncharacterized membrane protein YoaK (UPF0700 family)